MVYAIGEKLTLAVLIGNALLFTQNVFSVCTWRNKKTVLRKICVKTGISSHCHSSHLIVESFSDQLDLKNKQFLFLVQVHYNWKDTPYTQNVVSKIKNEKTSKYGSIKWQKTELSLQKHKKAAIYSSKISLQDRFYKTICFFGYGVPSKTVKTVTSNTSAS